ncbi:beta-1,2-xylosyltransferase XYXT1-like isoform X2 [Oryza brachyantha]|uniref:beta-1,2-xylosyltransferase XYXT1-like isoform X2 n=1 Tax=Oryza brachyantha TaxID=4533 RepID=UPI001ADC65AC|nr:beta-1,2-xylosyltransferase XYXT1-like isoform X2 [Oryza brachyantha]
MVTTLQSKPPAAAAPEPWTTSAVTSGVAKTLAQHHRTVVGFLFGFFLVLLLYTVLSGQVGSEDAIVRAVTQPSTPAVHTDQRGRTTSPPASPTSMSRNATQVHGNGHKKDASEKTGEDTKDSGHGTDKNNQEGSKFDNLEGKNNTEQSSEPAVNDASDRIEEELIQHDIDQAGTRNKTNHKLGTPRKPICDLSDPRYDVCEITGDARAMGTNRTVLYVPPVGERAGGDGHEWSIRDQSRKYLEYISKVTVRSLNASASRAAPACTSRHAVPAVVFAMNGLTSNPWHDFSDVLIPLFITARSFEGEVQFLVTDLQPWFVDKYRLILANLSRYDVVDFNQDGGVRCYPHVVVGLRSHRDLGIDPSRAPRNYTMLDFRLYVREIYSLPPAGVDIPFKAAAAAGAGVATGEQRIRPRAMLINRGRTRKFVNFPEIAAAVEAAGFEVIPIEPHRGLSIEEFSRVVDSCDVLMGAHGAGLTNFFFLRTNAVMLQVVPWGHMEHPSMVFYGGPAREMRLRDVEYSIAAEESTLYDKYGKDHPVIRDPESIHRQGWQFGMRYYWLEQDIKLNVTRFAPTLHQVLQMLRE